ncbi:VIT family protein [Synechococcus sp. BSF8S]|uniref:VIT1/CCC1 transporter family protein n=1 Tax=unclassified Synechococcus TaxID=2626047 RepID=UPI00351BF405
MAQQREIDDSRHPERHRTDRVGWLRAAVLGANDGIVSTASLLVGVAAAEADHGAIMLAGAAGLVAGAMSMAAGEYVSVSSQADTERADLARERQELADDAVAELAELTGIYVNRGLEPSLAQEVALQLTRHDALGAHARDELGITASLKARPVQAALTSAAMFSIGAALPLATASLLPASRIAAVVSLTSLLFLGVLGGLSARAGGAQVRTAVVRVTVWGAMAMAATALIGVLLGVAP